MEETVFFLNGNKDKSLLAFGAEDEVKANIEGDTLKQFTDFQEKHKNKYIFGYFGYDLKNEIENLSSSNKDYIGFPDLYFFVPKYVVQKKGDEFEFLKGSKDHYSTSFLNNFFNTKSEDISQQINLQAEISKNEYIKTVEQLKSHLQQGDIYEITYCQNFYAENAEIDPKNTYFKLNDRTKAPMSCYIALENRYLLSGSPERFIKKVGNRLFSQPIKGTAARQSDPILDEKAKNDLLHDEKERAENVMIVDLVRNDLSRIAAKNSVRVDELFGVYSFPTVHQLISTVSCEIKEGKTMLDIIESLFPMGSMTGAPKISAMLLIEKYETFKRGLFSGAVGYFDPNGDFDFNVIIRSILYNAESKIVSCPVGGAITIQSEPEKEYEECMLKVDAMRKILNGDV